MSMVIDEHRVCFLESRSKRYLGELKVALKAQVAFKQSMDAELRGRSCQVVHPSGPIGGWHSFCSGCTSGWPRWRGCRRAEDGSGRQASLQSPAAKGSASSCWPAKACCQLEGASYSTSQPQPPHCLSAQDVQESSTERAGEDFVCDSHALEE